MNTSVGQVQCSGLSCTCWTSDPNSLFDVLGKVPYLLPPTVGELDGIMGGRKGGMNEGGREEMRRGGTQIIVSQVRDW